MMSFRCPTQGRMPSRSRERRREKREWEIKLKLVKRKQTKTFDVAVIGGGMAGICAAIASARGGARTVLIQNRPMPGGNASSEIRMHICGAGCQMAKQGVNETGILLELLLENKRLNPGFNYNLWDAILTDRVQSTPGLELWLNTHCFDAVTRDGRIREIECCQSTTEIRLTVRAEIFIDCTGHGTVGYFSGADWRTGFEGKDETGECDAPAHGGEGLMGNTLLFKAVDRGHPCRIANRNGRIRFPRRILPTGYTSASTVCWGGTVCTPPTLPTVCRVCRSFTAMTTATGGSSWAGTAGTSSGKARGSATSWYTRFGASGITSKTAASTARKISSWSGAESFPEHAIPAV